MIIIIISIYNIDIHVTSGHIFSGKYGHTCTYLYSTAEPRDCELKGLSHEIFRPVFWPVWMLLGLNVNRLWF